MTQSNLWTKDEIDLLITWMEENPTTTLHYKKGNEELLSLLPNRSALAIYDKYRRFSLQMPQVKQSSIMEREKRHVSIPKDPEPKTHLMHILQKMITETIERFVTERVEISTAVILKENTEMKLLLQKLANVRQVINDFKL